jgi:hypothetical protein
LLPVNGAAGSRRSGSGFVARLACRIGLPGAGLAQRPRGVLCVIAEHETARKYAALHARIAGPVLDPLTTAVSLVGTTPATHDYTPVAWFADDFSLKHSNAQHPLSLPRGH